VRIGATTQPLDWPDLTGAGFTLLGLAQRRRAAFFPPPSALHRETKKPRVAILRCAPAANGARPIIPASRITIEAAAVVARDRKEL